MCIAELQESAPTKCGPNQGRDEKLRLRRTALGMSVCSQSIDRRDGRARQASTKA